MRRVSVTLTPPNQKTKKAKNAVSWWLDHLLLPIAYTVFVAICRRSMPKIKNQSSDALVDQGLQLRDWESRAGSWPDHKLLRCSDSQRINSWATMSSRTYSRSMKISPWQSTQLSRTKTVKRKTCESIISKNYWEQKEPKLQPDSLLKLNEEPF